MCEGFGRPGTRVIPCDHVTVVLDEVDGLRFSVGDGHPGYRSCPVGLAMWIALCQNDGRTLEAARTLAAPWGMRLEEVLAELHKWVGQLRAAGLVRTVG